MKLRDLFKIVCIVMTFCLMAEVANAQFCRNCSRSSSRTVVKSYGSTGGTYATGSTGGTYTAVSYGSTGGTPTQVIRRPRLLQRRNFVERSVLVDSFSVVTSRQQSCDCGCADCTCNGKAQKGEEQPLNPDRPPGFKSSESSIDAPKQPLTAAPK